MRCRLIDVRGVGAPNEEVVFGDGKEKFPKKLGESEKEREAWRWQ